MISTHICPHCHLPQAFTAKSSDPPVEAYCPNCGGWVSWEPAPAAQSPIVLCIDDDPLVLHFYRSFLGPHGYRVLTTTDGLAGLDLARRERPDVLLLDVMLRGLSGFDICRKFRADPALGNLPIILITVWDQANVAATGQEAGATLTLQKPADPETILTALRQVLRARCDPPAWGAGMRSRFDAEEVPPMATHDAAPAETPLMGPTVLCIDDDPRMLEFYAAALDPCGYRTLHVTDGLLGLGLARQERPDVILLDVMLAGLSGYDICRKFRADDELRTIPIVLITGMEQPGAAPTGQEVRADLILQKPVDPTTLRTTLRRVLGAPNGPTQA